MNLPIQLLIGQIVAIFSLVPMVLYGNPVQWVITAIVYACIMLSITILYHRLLSHRSFTCPLWFECVMMFFAHIMMVGPAIVWVANHREHHLFTDTDKDPHSPTHKGYFYSYFLQVFTTIKFKYVRDLLKINRYRWQVKFYWAIIFTYAMILYALDPFALVYAWLAPAGLAKLVGSLVFSYSHRGGEPHSDWWLGIITFGEGFHKEHHENPRAVQTNKNDIAGIIIRNLFRTD